METTFGKADPLTRRRWGERTLVEAFHATTMQKFTGKGQNNAIVMEEDLEKGFGSELTTTFLEQLPDMAVRGDDTLTGKSCPLSYKFENVCLDQIRLCPPAWKTKTTAQNRPNDLRKEAKDLLRSSFARLLDKTAANHLAGNTLANGDPFQDGNNEICAPSKNRHCFAGEYECEEEMDQDPCALMTLDDIADLGVLAKNHGECDEGTFRPLMMDGEEYLKLIVHPFVWRGIQKDPCFKEVMLATASGGDISNNPLFTGAKMVWNGVAVYESSRMPKGITKDDCEELDNVYRSVLLGAGAATMAYGGVDGAKGEFQEEMSDFGNSQAITLSTCFGFKKNRYQHEDACVRGKVDPRQCEDYATIVFSSVGCKPKSDFSKPAPKGEKG